MTTAHPTTRLGWTGMHLTRVGFGAWAIGGGGWAYAWGGQDDAASIAAIRHAVESGINWIDTAGLSNHDIFQLKDDDLSDIAAAIHATGAGTGPASPVQ
jgi:hypothetical protein